MRGLGALGRLRQPHRNLRYARLSAQKASMGDELGTANESENLAGASTAEPAAAVVPKPVALPPRPVSLPPRPASSGVLPSRPPGSPPPIPQRSLTPLPRPSQQPPPPPVRSSPTSAAPPSATTSVRPLPPSMRPAPPSVASTPLPAPTPVLSTPLPVSALMSTARQDAARIQGLLADVMSARQELTEKTTELRKATAERNTLRTRLARAEAQLREQSSALRAEAQLRSEAMEAHAATGAALRARVAELESALQESRKATAEPVGLRRIRGIGPAYERALLGLGITTVGQIAALSVEDIARIAPQIKAQADRILRDDWVGQAQRLAAE